LAQEPGWELRTDYPGASSEQIASKHGVISTSDGNDMEMKDASHLKKGTEIAENEIAQESATGVSRNHSVREGLKRRIGSLRRKN
jgi:hypothetical protein